ncbi:MAG: hypothetical protein ACOCZH_03445 [Phototrophicaceae bacterium]
MDTPTQGTPGRDSLVRLLHGWQRRFRIQQTVLWLSRAFLPGLLLGVGAAVISHLGPFLTNLQIAILTLAALVAGLTALLAGVWLWPRPVIDSARRFDRQFGLQERVSTALELFEGRIHTSDELRAHQLADAYSHARAVDARAALPLTSRRVEWLLAILLAALLAILLALPTQQAGASRDEPDGTAQIVDEAADDVRDAIESVASDSTLDADTRENLLETLQSSLETLRNPELSAEEALATLSETGQALAGESEQLAELSAAQQRAIEAAAEALRQPNLDRADPTESDEGSDSGETATGQQAADQLSELAEMLDSLNDAERQAFAEALREAADALQNLSPEAAQALREAARSLEAGESDAARDALEEAASRLEQAQRQQQNTQQLAEQMEQSAQQLQQGEQQLSERGPQEESEMSGGESGSDSAPESGSGSAEESDGPMSGDGQDDSDSQSPGSQMGEDAQPGETGAQQSAEMGADASSAAGDMPGGLDQDTTGFEESGQDRQEGGPGPGGESEYEAIFTPRQPSTERTDIDIFLETDDDDPIIRYGDFEQNPEGAVNVPYNEVFSDYASAASSALEQGYIPLGLRDVIRDYFTSLAPSTEQEQP